MKNRVVSATEFKAKCLALLDEVNENGGSVTVTKRGRPVAVLKPARNKPWKTLKGAFAGKFEVGDDIVNFRPLEGMTGDVENL